MSSTRGRAPSSGATRTRDRATTARSVELFRTFRVEQSDPDLFYSTLAKDSVEQVAQFAPVVGARVVDVGGGPGYFRDAFVGRGAQYIPLDADAGELRLHGRSPAPGTVMGDGRALPFRTSSVDIVYSSNVAEHVPTPWKMADEMLRITRSGGFMFLSYTLWYGPWGGHETSPWHYLGGTFAARRYAKKNGHEPKNVFGQSMYATTAAQGVHWARSQQQAEVVSIFPRYLPGWSWPIALLPVVREFVAWNLMLVLRKY